MPRKAAVADGNSAALASEKKEGDTEVVKKSLKRTLTAIFQEAKNKWGLFLPDCSNVFYRIKVLIALVASKSRQRKSARAHHFSTLCYKDPF